MDKSADMRDLLNSVRDAQHRMYTLCRGIGEVASDCIMDDMKQVRDTLDLIERYLMNRVVAGHCDCAHQDGKGGVGDHPVTQHECVCSTFRGK